MFDYVNKNYLHILKNYKGVDITIEDESLLN